MIELEKQLEVAKQVIKELAVHSDYMCEYCKHNIPCLKKECEFYESGKGMYDEAGKYFDWEWSCMDFNFGDCRKLENTPCKDCFEEDYFHFEWNGQARGDFNVD